MLEKTEEVKESEPDSQFKLVKQISESCDFFKKKLINTDFHLMSLLIPPLSLSHHYWFCVFQVTSPAQTARKMRRDRTCQRRFV